MSTATGSNPNEPRTIKASEFKAKCLKLMDEVAETGEEIVITKNGRPVARLVAYKCESSKKFFGADKGKLEILGDIISPIGCGLGIHGVDPDGVLEPVILARYPCADLWSQN